jgi:hypothetical protein
MARVPAFQAGYAGSIPVTRSVFVPSLSVVLPTRHGWTETEPVVESLLGEVRRVGGELLVVSGAGDHRDLGPDVRWITSQEQCLLTLRGRGVFEATGAVVAIGEDHAVPQTGWSEHLLAAHDEHPDADVVVGCLVNATDRTLAGRANFFAFAGPWAPPMPSLPAGRPPPVSAVSIKRRAFTAFRGNPGELEAELLPRLVEEGRAVADDRVRVDHHQDHGYLWSVRNAYDSARSSYGTVGPTLTPSARRAQARWTITNVPRRLFDEVRAAPDARPVDVVATVPIVVAAGVGAALGVMAGRGRAGERVA